MDKLLCIFLGGGLGSVLRYLITQFGFKFFKHFYIGTFIANILGCFLIGFVMGFITNKMNVIPENLKLLITIGFLGGLTTFSTFSFETLTFIKDGKIIQALCYIALSLFVGLAFTYFGYLISMKDLTNW